MTVEKDNADYLAEAALTLCVERGWATTREENGETVYSVDAHGRAFLDYLGGLPAAVDAYAATDGHSLTNRAKPEGVATPNSSSGGSAETAAETE